MLMSAIFKHFAKQEGDLRLERKGLVKDFIVPEAVKKVTLLDANVEDRKVVMSEGDTVYVLADIFGLANNYEEIDANIFFIKGGVVIELVEGRLLLQGENGEAYEVDETGDISYPDEDPQILWLTSEDLYDRACMVMRHRYHTDAETILSYVDNLVINVTMSYQTLGTGISEPVLTIRYATQYEDLGLGIFQFINYAEETVFDDKGDDYTDIRNLKDREEDEDDKEEDEEEDNYEYNMEGEEEEEEEEYEGSF